MLEIDGETYLDSSEAAAVLKCSPRQVQRYAESGRLPRRRMGRKDYYASRMVEMLADDLGVRDLPAAPPPPEIVPSGELLQRVEILMNALIEAERRATAAETLLKQLPPPDETSELRANLAEARAERDALRAELGRLQAPRPWYTLPIVWLGLALALSLVIVLVLSLMR